MESELQKILSRLISFYPVTSDQSRVKELLLFVDSELIKSGIKDSRLVTNNGYHMLTASTQGKKQTRLLLQAHVDVVPAKTALHTAKLTKDGRIVGRGARDMLFATAGYLWLINELKNDLSNLDLGIMLTGDEEIGGENTVPFLLEQGHRADVVWLPDAGSNLQEVVVKAKGVFNFTLSVQGRPHHGSRPWEGDNAALKLVRLLNELQDSFAVGSREASTCSITKLQAGDSVNKGPGSASAHIDIRFDSGASLEKIKLLLKELCDKYSAAISNLTQADSYTNDIHSPHIRQYLDVCHAITSTRPHLIDTHGSSDARYFSRLNIPVIMTRPTSDGSHSDDEWVDLKSLAEYCKVLKSYTLQAATITK